jgi:hypothetical protein
MFIPLNRHDLLRGIAVCVATASIVLGVYQLFGRASWDTPTAYGIDSLEVLARIKLAADEGFGAFFDRSSRLGAPFGADWSAYPQPDLLIYWMAGAASRLIGLMAASNLLLLCAHMAAAVSLFLSARVLGHRALFAGIAGILYGLSHFNFFRGLSHFSFTLSFILPPMLVVAWWIAASRRPLVQRTRLVIIAVVVLLAGAGNPYYAFIFLQALGWAVLFQILTQRNRENLIVGFATIAATLLSVLAWNFPALLARVRDPFFIDPVVRNYAGTELYALKLIDLFVPPGGHRLKALGGIGDDYAYSTALRGEMFGPYLGVVAIGALVWMFVWCFSRAIKARASLRPAYAPMVLWLILLGGVGGLQAFAAINGVYLFRGSNRYSVAILACALLFLTAALSRSKRLSAAPPVVVRLLAAVLLIVGLWDQLPAIRTDVVQQPIRAAITHDATFAKELEEALPRDAMIFQLPVVAFPEQPRVVEMSDYALFRPYLHTAYLRFSYGPLLNSREHLWCKTIAALPAAQLAAVLERAGFAAIYVNRLGYADRGAQLLSSLAALGYSTLPTASAEHVAVKLRPSNRPELPDLSAAGNLTPWKPGEADLSRLYAEAGWFELEQTGARAWRWFGGQALLAIDNDSGANKSIVLSFEFHALDSGTVRISQTGRQLWAGPVSRKMLPVSAKIPLEPGTNHLLWTFDGDLVKAGRGDPRRLGVCIINLSATFAK